MNARADFASAALFAGAGGACTGILAATGRSPLMAINHNPIALASHALNHPETLHLCEDVFQAQPWRVWRKLPRLALLWASPDCTHFSRAKGATPVSAGRRSLADVVIDWARQLAPRVIMLENVPEFLTWGPLTADNRPDPAHAGEHFQAWLLQLQLCGYRVEWRILRACDYGTPTIRRRLYLIARRDRRPIVWPAPTHGPGLLPYRSAAECIDWTDLGTSIFDRRRPLAEATQRRIAEGLRRFVLEHPVPFLIPARTHGGGGNTPRAITEPMRSITTRAEFAVVVPWLAKHYGGPRPVPGTDLRQPMGTVTAIDHHSLCAAHLAPSPGADRRAQVAAFLVQYYGSGGQHSHPADPLPAVVTRARHGLVTVALDGAEHVVTDITLRMLKPRELARAQGFPDSYQLLGTTAEQIAQIGNAVCPPVAEALVRANMECVA